MVTIDSSLFTVHVYGVCRVICVEYDEWADGPALQLVPLLAVCRIDVVSNADTVDTCIQVRVKVTLIALLDLSQGLYDGQEFLSQLGPEFTLACSGCPIIQGTLVFQRGPGWHVAYRQTRDSSRDNELEWRNACRRVWLAVVGHGQYGDSFILTAWVVCDVMSELPSHDTIVPLDLTIGLWMVRRGAHRFGSPHFHDGDEKVRRELGSLIR